MQPVGIVPSQTKKGDNNDKLKILSLLWKLVKMLG